jgi:hypothetical protein
MVDEPNQRALPFDEKAGFARLVKPHQSQGVVDLRLALDLSGCAQPEPAVPAE